MAGVSIGTGIVTNVGSNVISDVWKQILQVVKMVRALPTDVGNMNEEVQRLENLRDEINTELAREQRNAKTIVQNWLTKVGEAIDSSVSINTQYDQQENCLGCWPNYLCRYRISKDIRAWNLTVNKLQSERQTDFPPIGEFGDPTPRTHISIQHPEVAGDGIQAAQLELESWLTDKDSNIQRIGIHGMAGVGKTLLLDIINNSQIVRNSFQLILKVTVSRNKMLDLQDFIARRLNLRAFPDKSNSEERVEMLRSSLEAKQNYLVLLDDIWGDSDLWRIDDLQKLGVSLNNPGNKIVLTTRDKAVCARMNVQEIRTVPLLSEEEGWQLFRSRAFQNRNGDVPEDIEELARQIAKECKGLPLAITVIAAAMTKHTDLVRDWEDALGQLRNLPEVFYGLHDGVDERLFQRLRWSYEALKLPDLKTCFLYFAAYPEDAIISCTEVIDMWIADSLLKGNEYSFLHDTGRTYINQLRDRCLIEVAEKDARGRILSVRMHDVLRDLAILIAEKEHSCYFKAGQGVTRFPVAEVADRMGCARLSLMYNRLDSLPTTFACSSLSVLLLGRNPGIKEISGSFLSELPSLKVLDLSSTRITSLPSSIGDLKHLAFLQLRGTRIRELPETVGDLNNLQFLGVQYCNQLLCLPDRISELKRLRGLDIEGCGRLSQLPRGIAELVSLERLNMRVGVPLDFDDGNAERKHACLKDMQSLGCLRELSVLMKSPVQEGVIGNWSKMRDLLLKFSFGYGVNQDYLPQDMQAMKDLEILELQLCNVKRLPSWVSEFRRLECLTLNVCPQLEELELGMGFPKLQQLRLWGLNSLQCVRAVAAASGSGGLGDGASSLPKLKSLCVVDCTELKTLYGEWDKLKCLEEIQGEKAWWDALQWEDPSMKASLESKLRRRP